MKIAFVFPPIWPPHSDGSLSIWNREVTTRLARHNDVLVYSGKFESKSHDLINGVQYRYFSTRLDNRLINRRFQQMYHALGFKRPLFSMDIWFIVYALKIALDLRQQHCDVVHIYNYPQFAHFIKRLNPKLCVVVNMHGEWLTQIAFTNLHARLKCVDLVVSCSEFVTNSTSARFPDIANRCKTVPMGVSLENFSHADSESRRGAHLPRKLLYIGRISPEKGVHVLIDAFELIHQKFPDAMLTLVGPEWIAPREHIVDLSLDPSLIGSLASFYQDSYLAQLKKRSSPGAAKQIIFKGLVPHGEIPNYYANADVYINPSLYESFGMSIIEAMVAGLPVVTTQVGAVPELFAHGRSGLLVDKADPVAIAAAVSSLFGDAQLRTSVSSIAREASRQFSWDSVCMTLGEAYSASLALAGVKQERLPGYV